MKKTRIKVIEYIFSDFLKSVCGFLDSCVAPILTGVKGIIVERDLVRTLHGGFSSPLQSSEKGEEGEEKGEWK
jgi:hypothetical protein